MRARLIEADGSLTGGNRAPANAARFTRPISRGIMKLFYLDFMPSRRVLEIRLQLAALRAEFEAIHEAGKEAMTERDFERVRIIAKLETTLIAEYIKLVDHIVDPD